MYFERITVRLTVPSVVSIPIAVVVVRAAHDAYLVRSDGEKTTVDGAWIDGAPSRRS